MNRSLSEISSPRGVAHWTLWEELIGGPWCTENQHASDPLVVLDIPIPKNTKIVAKLLDANYIYRKDTNIMRTYREFGFIPPSEIRTDYLFKPYE